MSHKREERNEQGSSTIPHPEITTVNMWATPPQGFLSTYVDVYPRASQTAGILCGWSSHSLDTPEKGRPVEGPGGKDFLPLEKGNKRQPGIFAVVLDLPGHQPILGPLS